MVILLSVDVRCGMILMLSESTTRNTDTHWVNSWMRIVYLLYSKTVISISQTLMQITIILIIFYVLRNGISIKCGQ